jgi:hypothetical protein
VTTSTKLFSSQAIQRNRAQTQTMEGTRKGTSSSRCITRRAALGRRRWAYLSWLREFSRSGQPDLDHIAIVQAELISQIDVRDELDDPRISSILCRSRRPSTRTPFDDRDSPVRREAAVCLVRHHTPLGRTKFCELRSLSQTNRTRDRVRCSASRGNTGIPSFSL